MTKSEISLVKFAISNMTQEDLARIYRFAKSGHPYFANNEVYIYFMKRFKKLGGMTPAISKKIGWGAPI